MKKVITMAALMMAFAVNAQTIKFEPKTGDSQMDQVLKDIDAKAQKDIKVFTDEIATRFELPKIKIEEMVKTMPAGDVYMVAQTAEITKKPIDDVAKTYEANKGKGWGATAKELGIKPGSKEFHAMKDKVKAHGNKKDKGAKASNKGGKGKKDKEVKEKGSKEDEGKVKAETEKDEKAGGKGKGKK